MLPTDYTSFKVVARYPSPADDTIVIAKVSAYGKLALADVEGTVFVVNLELNPQHSLILDVEAPVVAFAWDPTDPNCLLIANNHGRLLLVNVEETESTLNVIKKWDLGSLLGHPMEHFVTTSRGTMAALTCGRGVYLLPRPFSTRHMGTTRLTFYPAGDTSLHAYRSQKVIALAFMDEERVLVGFPVGLLIVSVVNPGQVLQRVDALEGQLLIEEFVSSGADGVQWRPSYFFHDLMDATLFPPFQMDPQTFVTSTRQGSVAIVKKFGDHWLNAVEIDIPAFEVMSIEIGFLARKPVIVVAIGQGEDAEIVVISQGAPTLPDLPDPSEAASDSYGPFSDAEERNNHEDGAGSIIAAPIRRVGGNALVISIVSAVIFLPPLAAFFAILNA